MELQSIELVGAVADRWARTDRIRHRQLSCSLSVACLHEVWEPFFGDGSRTILNSSVSRILPIPDAVLGAFGYLLDAMTGIIGGRARWRKMPWIVVTFGLAVGPLGLVSVLLVILQPVLFDACARCSWRRRSFLC